ncbi:MFS transporter [Allokutzneria sp. NRRL B-24872]|uniref:MFS transporter n=1 Tax=Allokutzneria sp. NRRL B-24872 TaxID=1137961 RepID=UPI000A3A232F|nr:MFS transporter [Allokutzneria sp. NRRL B-24872]
MTALSSVPETSPVSVRHRWIALATLVLAILLVSLDTTVLSLAIPHLTESLKPTSTQILWIGDIYAFVLAGLLVTMGTLGDRVGRKKLLLIGSAGFGLFSAIAAFAPSANLLILARVVQGVAGATLMPSTLSIIRNIFTNPRERGFAVAVWGAMASAGAALGPLVGGVLLQHFWWGSVFLINVPVMIVLIGVGLWVLPESKDPVPGAWDLPSVFASLIGVVAVVYGVKELTVYGWAQPLALPVAALGVFALVWFCRRQMVIPHPLVDIRLFRNPKFSSAIMSTLLAVLGLAGASFILSQFLQLVQGYSPLNSGLLNLPGTVGAVTGGLMSSTIAHRWSARKATSIGLVVIAAGLCIALGFEPDTSAWTVGLVMFTAGGGAGLAFTVNANLVLTAAPKEKSGAASALSETAYQLGAALGIALLGSATSIVYRNSMAVLAPVLPQDVYAGARESIGAALAAAPKLPPEQAAQLVDVARHAFVNGAVVAAGVAAALLISAATLSWFVLREKSED